MGVIVVCDVVLMHAQCLTTFVGKFVEGPMGETGDDECDHAGEIQCQCKQAIIFRLVVAKGLSLGLQVRLVSLISRETRSTRKY